MLEHPAYSDEDCRALSEILGRIGDRWTMLSLGLLSGQAMRFNEMRRAMEGVSQRMLTLTLRGLERDGLVCRTEHPGKPPAVEYALTQRGQALLIPVKALAEWARAQRLAIEQSRLAYDEEQAAPEAAGIHRIHPRSR